MIDRARDEKQPTDILVKWEELRKTSWNWKAQEFVKVEHPAAQEARERRNICKGR